MGPKFDKLGMRGSNTCELIFDNCQVPGKFGFFFFFFFVIATAYNKNLFMQSRMFWVKSTKVSMF